MTDQKAGFLNPAALRKIAADREAEEARKAAAEEMRRAQEEKALTDSFMNREVAPQAMERVMAAVKKAAERGESSIQVFQFPSTLCKDSGRAINNSDPNWPETLVGFPLHAYEFFEEHLRPHGYKLRAAILNY